MTTHDDVVECTGDSTDCPVHPITEADVDEREGADADYLHQVDWDMDQVRANISAAIAEDYQQVLFGERTDVLAEAYKIIHGERAEQYGDARVNFARIAQLWSAYLGHPINTLDVANMMILLKVSRAKVKYSRDSYTDICGYAALAEILRQP